ncbi:AsmA family protein [Oligoflexus tunisiensis]|uniref:AsmA family protein n=1 Tax=Oligoflexus tunisiensis TaxID=708132 RepID=UPI000A9ED75F|nr:AsmA family protein [Oligoflexus tunisiensis]
MRTLLKIISGILAVFVILVASVFLIINLVDWNRHRDFLIRNVERYTAVRIDELDGIRVKLWRSLDLEVSKFKMHMAEKDAGLENFSTGPARIRVATWPLLFKDQLLIQTLTVDNGRLHLKETKKPEEPPTEDAQSPAEILEKLPDIFVNLAAITDAQFRYDILEKKEPIKVSIEKFEMQAPEKDPTPRFSGHGSVDEFPWKIEGETGTLETFQDEAQPFPLRLHAELGQQELDLNARVRIANSTGNFTVKAKGPNIEQIKKILHLNIGTVPAWQLAFESRMEPQNFHFNKIDLKLGSSEVNGDLHVDLRPRRPKISGKVESPVTVQKDWAGLFQTDQRYKPEDETPKPAGQYFSDKVIDNSLMKVVDVDLRYLVNHYRGEKSGRAIHAWDVTVKLDNGHLRVEPMTFAVASGKVGGHIRVDGRKLPLDVSIEMGAKRVDLTTLFAPVAKEIPVFDLKPSEMAHGRLTGQLDLTMTGKTPMELAKSVKGPIELAIEDGALSGTVIEAFGIDVSQTISNWIKKHPLYEIQCALTAFQAGGGVIKTKTFLISTKDTSIIGKGEVNLVGNKVDFVLEAHPHDFSVGSLRSPIEIKGPLNDIEVSLERDELLTRSGLAVALGALVNPIAALVPLIETGLDEKGKCRGVVQELNEVAAKATKLSRGESKKVRQ